jgi:hypothetical protein
MNETELLAKFLFSLGGFALGVLVRSLWEGVRTWRS